MALCIGLNHQYRLLLWHHAYLWHWSNAMYNCTFLGKFINFGKRKNWNKTIVVYYAQFK